MSEDYAGSRSRFSGFAAAYDKYRFRPPAVLAEILCRYVVRLGVTHDAR